MATTAAKRKTNAHPATRRPAPAKRRRAAPKAAAKSARKAAPKTARKTASKTASNRRAAAKSRARKPHDFVVSHFREEDFVTGGLRKYAQYRDLGVAAATQGLAVAHVIRFLPPFRAEEVSIPHYHDVDFQLVYVLKGWVTTEIEGQGAITMREGSCWIQPPRIKHTVLDYSDDCELLEIILPAEFDTVEV